MVEQSEETDPLLALLSRQVKLSQREIERLQVDNDRLRAQRDQAREEIRHLRVELDKARRAGKRQAAPFSRDRKNPDPKRSGRKAGERYGPKARRRPPERDRVDEQREVPLPECCPDCGGQVLLDKVVPQFQEEVIPARSVMRCYQVALGHCAGCKRRVRSRDPEQTSDALGAAGVMLGPVALALAAWLHTGLGVPMSKVAEIMQRLCGITVTPGGLHQALHKITGDAHSTYRALVEALRASPAVAADETGWRIDGERGWLWVYVGDKITIYDIAQGRGYAQACNILGEDFAGVLERDGWAPYRKFTHAEHQTCVAHLLRRCNEMIGDAVAGQAVVPHELRRILLDALAVRDQQLTAQARDDAIAGLRQRITRFCARRPAHEPNRRLVAHVTREAPHLLTFLTHPGVVEATNWRAEQAIRPMVCNRKSWGGNRTWRGAHTTAVLGSVLRTSAQQGLDPVAVLADLQRTGQIPNGLDVGPSP